MELPEGHAQLFRSVWQIGPWYSVLSEELEEHGALACSDSVFNVQETK